MRIVFAAARSAPGVTTAVLACASVWPGRVLLVEAAEDGGALAGRFALPAEPGVTTLAAAIRHDPHPEVLWAHTQPLPATDGRIVALAGPPTVEVALPLWRATAGRLAGLLAAVADRAVLIDAGRLSASPSAAPLIADADRLVIVVRPRVEELQSLAQRLPILRQLGPAPELLLVGEQPYGPDEIAATLGCPVVGVLADDRAAAEALAGTATARRLGRSLLLRTAASVVDRLTGAGAAPAARTRPDAEPGTGLWPSLARGGS